MRTYADTVALEPGIRVFDHGSCVIHDEDDLDRAMMPDEAYSLDAFKRECQKPLEAFAKLHGRAFLLLSRTSSKAGRLNVPEKPTRTLVSENVLERTELPSSKYLVYALRKTERSLIAHFYWVGQTRNNDIVIRDVSVSKSHAFFQDAEDGAGFTLQDARSRNGTFVNGRRVPRHREGEPTKVRTGDLIRFGDVELSFVDAETFRDFVRTNGKWVSGSPPTA